MSSVYRAEDLTLERTVAVKVLKPTRSDPKSTQRFIQEAKIASKIGHPNVITLYDIVEQDNENYLVMEHIGGPSLRERMEKKIDVLEVIRMACEIAAGLEAAHAQGVVHRDVKPENVMVTKSGLCKVLDFGVAHIVDTARLTTEGRVVGTPFYMAPEQLLGKEIDARTDIYALGVVLYEMLSSQMPFAAKELEALGYQIVNVDPPALTEIAPEVPSDIGAVVHKAMAKNPVDRYQSMSEMLQDLKVIRAQLEAAAAGGSEQHVHPNRRRVIIWTGVALACIAAVVVWQMMKPMPPPATIETKSSIVVLPFVNLSGNPAEDYLADGITEDLIYALTKTGLRVVSRTSAFQFKGQQRDIRDIGERLDVETALEGTVRRDDDRLILTASLVAVSDGYQIWSNRYEVELSDIFTVENEISMSIVQEMQVDLASAQRAQMLNRYTEDLDAYMLYLQGRYFWNERTVEALKKAQRFFERAIEKDSNYALAYAGLADAYLMGVNYSTIPAQDGFAKAKSAALRAIEIDDQLAEAHASLALALWIYDWDWRSAEKEFERAGKLRSGYATTHHWYALFLGFVGKYEEALAQIEMALRSDPVSLPVNSAVALMQYTRRDYDAAIAQSQRTLELKDDYYPVYTVLAKSYAQKAMYAEAVAGLQKQLELTGRRPVSVAWLGHIYAVSGQRDHAMELLAELQSGIEEGRAKPFHMVVIHVGLGNLDEALLWLEKSAGSLEFDIFTIQSDPMLEKLREHRGYRATLEKIGISLP